MESIIIEFEKVTKYPLVDFLLKYKDFALNSLPSVDDYFSGKTETIDNDHLNKLKELTSECKDVLSQFKNFSNKFSKCGYWELLEYIEDLDVILEKINKFPKFKRTSLTKRGYKPYIQIKVDVGSQRTVEDVANSIKQINKDNSDWINLMHANDWNESDWDIDELTPIEAFVNNVTDVVVTTILDSPIGNRIYGKDISRKIEFLNDDLQVKEFEDNIEQKCNILLELNRGDVPENMLFGKNILTGTSFNYFSYPELVSDIQNNFLQNDLFQYVNILGFNFENGNISVDVEIKTKYDYKTEQRITI